MQLERRCGLANGRCGRFQAAHPGPPGGTPGPRPILPEQAQSEKSQGVRGTESPDSFNNTLKKTENTCPFFRGKYSYSTPTRDVPGNGSAVSKASACSYRLWLEHSSAVRMSAPPESGF